MELFKLLGTIAIDNSKANESIDDTTGKAEQSESKMSAAFKKIGTAVAAAFTIDKIIDFGRACVESAASVRALTSQYEQTFGELQETATEAIGRVATESGILETRLRGVGTQIYAFAKSSGADSAEAMSLMETALQATADAAAYYDRSLEDTAESLQSFLKGNFANDAALGVSCTETTRNAAAMELFGQKYQDLSEIQKQQTLLKMVTDAQELSGAMGQASRESEGWENVTGNLKESWSQLLAVLGTPVLDALVPVVQNLTTGLSTASEKVQNFFSLFSGAEEQPITGMVEVTNAFGNYISFADEAGNRTSLFREKLNAVFGSETVTALIGAISSIRENITPFFDNVQILFGTMCGYFQTIWTTIGQPIWDAFSWAIGEVATLFTAKMPEIMQFFSDATAGIQDSWNNYLKPVFDAIGHILTTYLIPAFQFAFTNFILPTVSNVFTTIGRLWTNVLKPIFDGICTFLLGVFTLDIGTALTGVQNIFVGVFNAILEAINSIMENVKTTVEGAVQFLVDVFDFDWELPQIKLPHFSITGGFSLNPPSSPSFSIEWYKDGGVMTDPTMFGFNPLTGKAMVGGEAGAEAIAPIDVLQGYVAQAVASQNQGLIDVLYRILEAIIAMDENMGGNLREALAGTSFEVDRREFARLVKAVN